MLENGAAAPRRARAPRGVAFAKFAEPVVTCGRLPRHLPAFMTFSRIILLLAALCALRSGALAAEPEARFSKTLPAAELSAAGLGLLSSDQLAILDALVRRDIAAARFVSKQPRAPQFSARLTADERHNAGLDLLGETEVAALDASVQRLIVPPAPAGGFGITGARGPYSVPSLKLRRDPKIETHMTAMVAVGSDGYSAFGAGVEVSYVNPDNDFGLSLSYSELHEKGGSPYRYDYDRYGYDRYGYGYGLGYGRSLDPFGRRW